MKNYNSIVSLIKKLSSEELKSLLKFLSYYNENNILSKSKRFVELIVIEENLNPIVIQKSLYGKENAHAFNKLIDRLKDKILEVVLFDSNITKNYYPERVKVLFDLKKKLIQSDILSLKGLRDDGDLLCRKIISKAEKYEMHDIVMNALVIRQRFVNIRRKQSEIQSIQTGIEVAENKYKSVIHAQFIYNVIINKISNSSDSSSYFSDLISAISDLEKEYLMYESDIVGYYLNFLKTEQFQIEEKYHKAEECLSKINDFILKKSIYSDNRMGTTLLNIANIKIHLLKYDDAISNAERSRKYFPNNVFNQALVDEYLFYAFYYNGKIAQAETIIKKLVNLPEANNILFSISKWNYFHAVVEFLKGDFEKCIQKLNNIEEIDKDKEGWNINKRLLLIIARIELKQFESVDLQVASLEKFIKRSLKRRDVRLRYIYIMRILIKLINSNYDYNSVYKERKRYFNLLDSESIDLKWKIKSPELVRIDDWFKSKIK